MSQTYASLYIHVIFGTKNRRPFLNDESLARCCSYMAGLLSSEGAKPIRLGGYTDHLHLLIGLHQDRSVSSLVRQIKASSSVWLKREVCGFESFAWQGGYAAFSVSHGNVAAVSTYIDAQKEHHHTKSFQEELADLLLVSGIAIDKRFSFFFD